jgi:hypothetical protein
MLMDAVSVRCDIFPKTKYRLYINNKQQYYFVTTKHNEDKCIEFMEERIKDYFYISKVYYKIVKVRDGKEIVIKRGKV